MREITFVGCASRQQGLDVLRLICAAVGCALLLGGSSALAQAVPEGTPAATTEGTPAATTEGAPAATTEAVPAATTEGSVVPAAEPAKAAWDYLDQPAAATDPAASEELDLTTSSQGLDEEVELYPKFDLYGFSDLTFSMPVNSKNSAWSFYLPRQSTFYVGNINVYFASQISKVLRSLIEVRFTYLPHGKNRGGTEASAPGAVEPFVDTSASDYTDAERPIKLGAIEIERVQAEYAPVSWLSIIAGQWLTPYGIWNVDHGTPTTIDTHKPYIIGEQYLPERQTGLLAQGSLRRGIHRFGYNVGVSNGRGPIDAYYDMDNNKAGTLHLSWQSNSPIGDLTLGASGYVGRYTNSQRKLTVKSAKIRGKDTLQLTSEDTIKEQYDEYSLAMDAQWSRGGFQVFSEVAMNVRRYTDAGRPELQGSFLGLIDPTPAKRIQPDTRRIGGYLIGGYRFSWLGIMPYAQIEYVYLDTVDLPATAAATLGFNVRPHESVTLKLHYGHAIFPGADQRGPGRDEIRALASQIAWAF